MSSLEYLNLYLVLDDGKKIRLRVFDPALRGSTYRSPQLGARRAGAITDAITSAPTVNNGTQAVVRRLRWVNVTLIVLPFPSAAAILALGR